MQPLVDLEARLALDSEGEVRAALRNELEDARAGLRERLARGGSVEQYKRWAASERAIGAALSVLEKVHIEPPTADRIAGPAINLKGE
jgi:type III secretion system YseE family protein